MAMAMAMAMAMVGVILIKFWDWPKTALKTTSKRYVSKCGSVVFAILKHILL